MTRLISPLLIILFVGIAFHFSVSSCSSKKNISLSKQDSLNIYQTLLQSENINKIDLATDTSLIETTPNLKNIKINDLDIPANEDHEITIDDAQAMVKEYLHGPRYFVHRLRKANPWRPDTRCVWFEKKFVDKLHDAVSKNGRNGIRLYFGIYEDPKYGDLALYKSIIITVTKPKEIPIAGRKKVVANFDDLDLTDTAINSYWQSLFINQKRSLPPYNRGGLCPPPNDSCKHYGALLLPDN